MRAATTIAVATLMASAVACQASDWFPFDRTEALSRVRGAVEKLEKVAPLPELSCKPAPAVLRYCAAKVTDRLTFEIVETFRDDGSIASFQKGGPGVVHEIRTTVKTEPGSPSELDMFDTLCTASVLALRPKMNPQAAYQRFASALRRSANKSRTDDSTVVVVGDPDTLVVSVSKFDMSCVVSAEDDYRLK